MQGNDMFVNFINPRYPGEDTAAGTCHFRLLKNSPDICQIRVDFVDTVKNYIKVLSTAEIILVKLNNEAK